MGRNSEQTTYAAANLRENVVEGAVNEAHAHAGMVQDTDARQLLDTLATAFDPDEHDTLAAVEESDLYQTVLRNEATAALTDAVAAGNVSQMQFAVGMVDNSEDGRDALSRVAQALTNEGMVVGVLGPPGAGKTATMLDIARIWKALTGGTIVSDIESWDGTDIVVHNNVELKDAMQSVEGLVLGVLDEVSKNLTGQGEDVKKAEAFAKDAKKIRKRETGDRYAKQGSLLLCGHTRTDTAADIRRLFSLVVEKPVRQDPGRLNLYDSQGGKDQMQKIAEYKGITDTSEDYDEHDPADFDVVVDDGNGEDSGPSADEIQKRKDVETAITHKMNGDSHDAAAEYVDYGSSWVGERWREWLRGDHRDIVPMPEDPPDAVETGLERID